MFYALEGNEYEMCWSCYEQMDRTLVAREAIEVIHYHWKTYLDAAKKGPAGPDGGVEQHFQYT